MGPSRKANEISASRLANDKRESDSLLKKLMHSNPLSQHKPSFYPVFLGIRDSDLTGKGLSFGFKGI